MSDWEFSKLCAIFSIAFNSIVPIQWRLSYWRLDFLSASAIKSLYPSLVIVNKSYHIRLDLVVQKITSSGIPYSMDYGIYTALKFEKTSVQCYFVLCSGILWQCSVDYLERGQQHFLVTIDLSPMKIALKFTYVCL